MGDEPAEAVMPSGDTITFENTYLQKPEDHGEVRASAEDTAALRPARRHGEPRGVLARRARPGSRARSPSPIFGTFAGFAASST
jgi:hypothetical protein